MNLGVILYSQGRTYFLFFHFFSKLKLFQCKWGRLGRWGDIVVLYKSDTNWLCLKRKLYRMRELYLMADERIQSDSKKKRTMNLGGKANVIDCIQFEKNWCLKIKLLARIYNLRLVSLSITGSRNTSGSIGIKKLIPLICNEF